MPKLLNRYSLVGSSIILGFFHGIWHLPLHFMKGTVQINIPIFEFVLVTILGAFIYTWLYIKTKNLLTAIIFHWSSNYFSFLFKYWTSQTGRYIFLGILIIFVVIIINKEWLKGPRDVQEES